MSQFHTMYGNFENRRFGVLTGISEGGENFVSRFEAVYFWGIKKLEEPEITALTTSLHIPTKEMGKGSERKEVEEEEGKQR